MAGKTRFPPWPAEQGRELQTRGSPPLWSRDAGAKHFSGIHDLAETWLVDVRECRLVGVGFSHCEVHPYRSGWGRTSLPGRSMVFMQTQAALVASAAGIAGYLGL